MLFAKSRLFVFVSLLIVGICSAYAASAQRADTMARDVFETLIERLNLIGIQVEVDEISVSPTSRSVLLENIRIQDRAGRAHSVESLTLKNIELNAQGGFIESFQLDVTDAVVTLVKLTDQQNRLNALHYYLQALGINSGRIGHHQTLIVHYDADAAQLQLDMEGQMHHPADNRSRSLVDFHFQGHFSDVPDLQKQLLLLGTEDSRAALTLPWMQVGLIEADLAVQDQGAWEPMLRSAAANENMTVEDFRAQLKQQWQKDISEWKVFSTIMQQTFITEMQQFVDSPQPTLQMSVNATNPNGMGLMLATMSAMVSPVALEQMFRIVVDAE